MSDSELVAGILKRWATSGDYWCQGEDFLTLDGRIDITPEESAALGRILGDGQGW